jgi:hypothetical protein
MNMHNAAVALLSEELIAVKVRFKWSNGELSPKQYSYVSTIDLQVGDEAVVNSPFGGYKVVVVEEVTTPGIHIDADFESKFIVQRVDKEADEARQKAVAELKRELSEQERQKALKKLKKAFGIKQDDRLSKIVKSLRKNLI